MKWIALVLMTGDHVLTVFGLGYVPVVYELGRIAFPVFAIVLAYNLAQPGVDAGRAAFRLAIWGVIAAPIAFVAFGSLFPLNVLLTFAASAAWIWAYEGRQWLLACVLAFVVPAFLDYAWPGVWLVIAAWFWFGGYGRRARDLLGLWEPMATKFPFMLWLSMGLLCWYNGNGWALLAVPVVMLAEFDWRITRAGRFFYLYYIGHLGLLAWVAALPSNGFLLAA
ncbi:UNVERIFIED_ORG: hypothetical protein M2420_000824 [Stenotrophomonas maltophilia]